MIQHIVPPLFLLVIYFYALSEAKRDAKDIGEHKPIHHGKRLVKRVCWGLVFLIWAAVCSRSFFQVHPPALAPLALSSAALFSLRFRLRLNHLRNQPWWYMGPLVRKPTDSTYDGWWIRLMRGEHKPAGIACTIFEITVLALSWGWTHYLIR